MNNKKNLLFITLSIVGLLVVAVLGYNYLSSDYTEAPHQNGTSSKKVAKDFTVYNANGEEVKLSDYKGKKPVVVNFWASWCPPCKSEMPYFQDAKNNYSSDDIEILMVNLTDGMRETVEVATQYINDNNYDMNFVFDEKGNAANTYYISAVPRTLFIDKEGTIIKDHTGIISSSDLNKYIEQLIGE